MRDLICTNTNIIVDTISLEVILSVVVNIRLLNMFLLSYEWFRGLPEETENQVVYDCTGFIPLSSCQTLRKLNDTPKP